MCRLSIIPFELEAAEDGAFPVFGDLVLALEDVSEMFGVFFSNIFNSKVVYYQGKCYWPGFMFEEAGGCLDWW